jgi:hypothetical protein
LYLIDDKYLEPKIATGVLSEYMLDQEELLHNENERKFSL